MSDTGFMTDYKRNQIISGLTAAVSLFFGVILIILVPATVAVKKEILTVFAVLGLFTIVYYLIPALYTKEGLRLLPDIVYIIGIALTINLLGEYGYLFVFFYLLLLAIDAFIFPPLEFGIALSLSVVGILAAATYPDLILRVEYIVGLYIVVASALVLRIFAKDALEVKREKLALAHSVEELEADKREIRALLESLSDGLVVVNAQNKITFFNTAAFKILGVMTTEERVLGRDINDFMPTVGKDGSEPITREVFGTLEHSIRNDFRIVKPEKTLRLHTNISPVIAEKAELKGAVIFFRDITNEKRVEEQRAEFNAVASHELRTPLSVIEGYLYYILDPSSKLKYDKETREYVERAHVAAQDLNSLVTDILTVVKAEEGELEVTLKSIEPVKFFEEVTQAFEARAKEKKVGLSFKVVAHETVPEIITDPVKAKEILSNLVGNAVKFTDKGTVKVELGILKKEIIVTVSDTGIGIKREDLGGIYHKFYRAENWQTRKTGGAGLGLYIVKTLVERLGGKVGVQSEIGRGSKFYFTLPLEYKNEADLVSLKEGGSA